MSGPRNFIYLYRRPAEKWEDISCKTLNFAVKAIATGILAALIGAIVLWCLL